VTHTQLLAIMARHGLSREDLAAIAGKTTRQTYSWTTGIFAVPRSLAIVLYALDEGKIDPGWIVKAIRREHGHA
jgi:hypothetical protein